MEQHAPTPLQFSPMDIDLSAIRRQADQREENIPESYEPRPGYRLARTWTGRLIEIRDAKRSR